MRAFSGRLLLFCVLCVSAVAAPAAPRAQEVAAGTVRLNIAEENLRSSPNGPRIAIVLGPARLAAGPAYERWRPVTLSGWIAAGGVTTTSAEGYDLVVDEPDSEILAAPAGTAIARAPEGLLLDEVERRDGWVHVTRSAWLWNESLTAVRPEAPAPAPAPPPSPASVASDPASTITGRTILDEPDGDAIASVAPAARMEILSREGDWTRVRVEGWISTPDAGVQSGPLQNLSLTKLKAEPVRYQGTELVWDAQFVALQQADSIRADLVAGEWYILARDPNGVAGFVYIVVPTDELPEASSLYPLQHFTFHGRVRSGSSRITGHPVIDLLEITSLSP